MINLIDYILDLFRDESHAQAFVANPEQAMAVLGNGNTVNNGAIHAGAGSTVAVGDSNAISEGNTSAGGDVLSSHDGTVIQTSGHGTTSVSAGNTSGVDNSTTLTHTSTVDNSVHDSSVHSSSVVDSSVHESSVHDSSIHDTSLHDNSIHQTTHQGTGLDAHLGF